MGRMTSKRGDPHPHPSSPHPPPGEDEEEDELDIIKMEDDPGILPTCSKPFENFKPKMCLFLSNIG